jgi:transcription elongation GreA/GreB family factor
MDSPLGRALLGKRANDEVEVSLPGGARSFSIVAIEY